MSTLLALLSTFFLSNQAHAGVVVTRFTCNIGGVPSQMVARVEGLADGALTHPGDPNRPVLLNMQQTEIRASGEITNAYARYSFVGGEWADAMDMRSGARFRIRFEAAPGGVWVIVNPWESGHDANGSGRFYCKLDSTSPG